MNPIVFLIAVSSVTLNALAQIALRNTMLSVGSFPSVLGEWFGFATKIMFNLWFIAGMGCYAISIGLWLIVLGKLEVSIAYPLLSIGYVITAVIGYFFMQEDVNLIRIAGLSLIILGICVISRS